MKTKMMIVLAVLFSLQSFGKTLGQIFANVGTNYSITTVTTLEVAPNLPADIIVAIAIQANVSCNSVSCIVTNIGDFAFNSFYYLKSVSIGNSATQIRREAFAFCTRLCSINIPSLVTAIGNIAFRSCHLYNV